RLQHHAHIAGTGDAHDQALIARWIPAACLRQRYGEGRAGEPEREREQLELELAVQPGKPRIGDGDDDQELRPGAGRLGADVIGERSQGHAQHGTGENRYGDDIEAVANRKPERSRYIENEWAERDPDHEAEIEIEEGGQQSWPVAGFPEVAEARRHDAPMREARLDCAPAKRRKTCARVPRSRRIDARRANPAISRQCRVFEQRARLLIPSARLAFLRSRLRRSRSARPPPPFSPAVRVRRRFWHEVCEIPGDDKNIASDAPQT